MKNILLLYAKYNKDTNSEIIKLLSGLSDDELNCERKMYYKSISNLFNHLVIGGWYYLYAVRSIAGMSYPIEDERQEIFKRIEVSFIEASKIMQDLDERLIEVIEKLTIEELKLERKNNRIYNGRVVDITIWEYITQHIIHQTHHRGQISYALDELNVSNDFGNIFPYIKDSIKVE